MTSLEKLCQTKKDGNPQHLTKKCLERNAALAVKVINQNPFRTDKNMLLATTSNLELLKLD